MAEVHIIGQLLSATGFPENRVCCHWNLQYGGGWRLLEGTIEGQTQTDNPALGDAAYFCHPIDIHLATRSMQGWPKIQVQVWHQDSFGRQELCGYGFCHVPCSPGEHEIQCPTWRPVGSFREEVMQRFVGGGLQLRNTDIVLTTPERYKLNTAASGTVTLRLGVILRNFDKFGIDC